MTEDTLPDDPTLEEVRAALAPRLAAHAGFDGWGPAAVDAAADEEGVDRAIARLAFAGGAVDLVDAWFDSLDRRVVAAFPVDRLEPMRVSGRIRAFVEHRLDLMAPDREGLRRALGVLARPQNLATTARLGWRTADRLWRLAGDTATDWNHYSKRAILMGVYGSTIAVFLDDDSEGQADTRAFLGRRLAEVGRFEQVKAKLTGGERDRLSLTRFLGRLRYPAV